MIKNDIINIIDIIPSIIYLHEKHEEKRSENPRLHEFLAEKLKKYTFFARR